MAVTWLGELPWQMMKYLQMLPSIWVRLAMTMSFPFLSCIPSVISGGDGCIGAISNIRPDICADIIRSLASENISELTRLQRSIDKYFALYEVHTPFNPVMKWALKEMGLPVQEYCRVPIKPLTDKQKEALSSMANELWRKA